MAKLHRTPLAPALGLATARPGRAWAGDSTPPAQSADAGPKAAIDKDGHLRAPTTEEQKQLAATPKALRAEKGPVGKPTISGHDATQPRTEREAMATYKAAPNGMRTMAVPEELMSTLTVTRGADGKLVVSEGQANGAGKPAAEVADE